MLPSVILVPPLRLLELFLVVVTCMLLLLMPLMLLWLLLLLLLLMLLLPLVLLLLVHFGLRRPCTFFKGRPVQGCVLFTLGVACVEWDLLLKDNI